MIPYHRAPKPPPIFLNLPLRVGHHQNPSKSPIAISTTGWYTFEDHFYDQGGVLAVDMSIYDSSKTLVNTWTLSNPADLITGIGGNRYGWFDYNKFTPLAFDNSSLTTFAAVPEPATLISSGVAGALCLVAAAWRRRKTVKPVA